MRACIQRVSRASVTVEKEVTGQIKRGLLVLLGVGPEDGEKEVRWLVDKIVGLRIFPDDQGKMNLSLADIGGALLVVSQFTLLGNCQKGRRPSFINAAPPGLAEQLYERFIEVAREQGTSTETGRFRADMQVELVNDGPVTLIIESSTAC